MVLTLWWVRDKKEQFDPYEVYAFRLLAWEDVCTPKGRIRHSSKGSKPSTPHDGFTDCIIFYKW
ncbi:hypothetical protein Hanom_Chr11g00998961 [Helianthus anomalus]